MTSTDSSLQPDLSFDDYSLTASQLAEIRAEQKRIITPVLNGEKTELYKSFKDFEEKGVFDIKGCTLIMSKDGGLTSTGWKQLRAAAEIYRNKKFETFRYILVDRQGKIADQLAISSCMPNICLSSLPDRSTYKQVISRAVDMDCKIILCHNHPSGNIIPSNQDMNMTSSFDLLLSPPGAERKFLGHIILDHDSFSLAVPGSKPGDCKWETVDYAKNGSIDRFVIPGARRFPDKNISTPYDLLSVAQQINDRYSWNDNFIPLIFLNSSNTVSALQYFSFGFFKNDSKAVRDELRHSAFESGSVSAVPIFNESVWNKLSESERKKTEDTLITHIKNHVFFDVVIIESTFSETSLVSKYDLFAIASERLFTNKEAHGKTPEVSSTWEPYIHEDLFHDVSDNSNPNDMAAGESSLPFSAGINKDISVLFGKTGGNRKMIYGYSPLGYEGRVISIDIDLRKGIPCFDIVGLADGAVKTQRDTIISAFRHQKLPFPSERILMSLNPVDIRKSGLYESLAMSLSILNSEQGYPGKDILVMGTVDDMGRVMPVRCCTPAVEEAMKQGIDSFVVPIENSNEVLSIPGAKVLPVESLRDAHEKLVGNEKFFSLEHGDQSSKPDDIITFDEELIKQAGKLDLAGYYDTCRAIELAVAGNHNLLLEGSPGSGKTYFSQNLIPALTPDLTHEEARSVSRIYSIAGLLKPDEPVRVRPPFRIPHNSSTLEGMLGGGIDLRPGEITLAHKGTLFLDDADFFRTSVLQSLVVPLDNKNIRLSRAGRSTAFPADFQLVITANPCPCGNHGSGKLCLCSAKSIDQHWKKFSDSLLSRIEIKQHVQENLDDHRKTNISEMRSHIENAYRIQRENGIYNSDIRLDNSSGLFRMDRESHEFFDSIKEKYNHLEGHNLLKVALTIANTENRREISLDDIRESSELISPVLDKPNLFRREPSAEANIRTVEQNPLKTEEPERKEGRRIQNDKEHERF